jgi:FeS assembly SUF system protein
MSDPQNENPQQPEQSGGESGGELRHSGTLQDRVVEAIKRVYDPEIPVNIYDLGLIYEVDAEEETGRVQIQMTLTTPNCPEAQSLPEQVERAAEMAEGAGEATVQIVWDPPWNPDKMSDEAKLELGMM